MSKLDDAIKFATDAHAGQKRKLTKTPYILHPLEVATIASKLTDDEDVICATLLHDVVEDTSHEMSEIETLFGHRIAELVGKETEDKRPHLPPSVTWQTRKEETLERLRQSKDKAVKIMWLADKLSNIRSVYNAYMKCGDEVWNKFNVHEKSKHKWYYYSVAEAVKEDLGYSDVYLEYSQRLQVIFGKETKNEN